MEPKPIGRRGRYLHRPRGRGRLRVTVLTRTGIWGPRTKLTNAIPPLQLSGIATTPLTKYRRGPYLQLFRVISGRVPFRFATIPRIHSPAPALPRHFRGPPVKFYRDARLIAVQDNSLTSPPRRTFPTCNSEKKCRVNENLDDYAAKNAVICRSQSLSGRLPAPQ